MVVAIKAHWSTSIVKTYTAPWGVDGSAELEKSGKVRSQSTSASYSSPIGMNDTINQYDFNAIKGNNYGSQEKKTVHRRGPPQNSLILRGAVCLVAGIQKDRRSGPVWFIQLMLAYRTVDTFVEMKRQRAKSSPAPIETSGTNSFPYQHSTIGCQRSFAVVTAPVSRSRLLVNKLPRVVCWWAGALYSTIPIARE
jgi:hypothetical protein